MHVLAGGGEASHHNGKFTEIAHCVTQEKAMVGEEVDTTQRGTAHTAAVVAVGAGDPAAAWDSTHRQRKAPRPPQQLHFFCVFVET